MKKARIFLIVGLLVSFMYAGTMSAAHSSTASGPTCAQYLTSYVKAGVNVGSWDNIFNVTLIQLFLNSHMNAGLALTGTYDAATQQAVNQFQVQYHAEVLRPWVAYGLPNEMTPTAHVYKTTSWKMNNLACHTNTPMPMLP